MGENREGCIHWLLGYSFYSLWWTEEKTYKAWVFMSVTGEQSVSVRPYLLAVTKIASLRAGRTVRPINTKTLRVWNRERFITDSYKEMGGDSCPKNPKVTESFQKVPLKAKGDGWVW